MTTVTAIVLSYNRPRMLAAALATVRDNRPDRVVVVDDGSNFDVRAVVREYCPAAEFVIAPPMTVAERLVTPRLGSLINRAMDMLTTEICAPICDDDLWADGWLDAVRAHFAAHPDAQLVRGEWRTFSGALPADDAPLCALDARQMTTGNFAHRLPAPARWPEHTISSHDDIFLWNLQRAGIDTFNAPLIGNAGYRREHAHNALNFTRGHHYTAAAAGLLGGWLED